MNLFPQSAYDAAHVYVTSAKSQEAAMMPLRISVPTVATVFEIGADGRIFRVKGSALQRWIIKQRQELGGPRGQLFRQTPDID
jgi:hypothetical protein